MEIYKQHFCTSWLLSLSNMGSECPCQICCPGGSTSYYRYQEIAGLVCNLHWCMTVVQQQAGMDPEMLTILLFHQIKKKKTNYKSFK